MSDYSFMDQAKRDAAKIAELSESVRERLAREADWPSRRDGKEAISCSDDTAASQGQRN
jgi:hypothetical protein